MTLMLAACASQDIKPTRDDAAVANDKHTAATDSEKEAYQAGITALKNKDYTQAEHIFSDLLKNNDTFAGAYCNLAIIYFKANDYDTAAKLANKALEVNPGLAQAYNLRAQINVKIGKIDEAKNDYIKAVELNPSYANAHYNLALLYDIYMQDINMAIKHYEIYLSLLSQPDQQTSEWLNHLKGSLNNG